MRLTVALLLGLTMTAGAATGAPLQLEQKYAVGFSTDWNSGILPYSLPHEGKARLAITNAAYIMGLEWSEERNNYVETFFIERDFYYSTVAIADGNGDNVDDVIVVDPQTKETKVYDSVTGAPLKPFTLKTAATFAATEDLDGIPGAELLVADDGVSAYKGGLLLWHANVAAQRIAAGGEESAGREIFVATTNAVVGLDPVTGAERHRLPRKCFFIATAQTDGDAGLELACDTGSRVDLVDVATDSVQWTRPYSSVRGMAAFDADNNGRQDLLVRNGDMYSHTVWMLNGADGQPFSPGRQYIFSGPAVPVTGSCGSDPFIAMIKWSEVTSPDSLLLLDPTTLAEKVTFALDTSEIDGIAVADFDADGRQELVARHDGKVQKISFQPYTRSEDAKRGTACCYSRGIAAAQLDRDPQLEVVVAWEFSVAAFDGVTYEPMWSAPIDDGESPYTVQIADLNGDGQLDVVTSTVRTSSGAKGTFVYAYDGATGKRLWRSVNIPQLVGDLAVADSDGDGVLEVLALSSYVGIVRLNAATGTVLGFDEFKDGAAFALVNADSDPQLELVVAAPFSLFILDDGKKVKQTTLQSSGTPSLIKVADLDGDGVVDLLLARRTSFEVRALATLAVQWASESYPEPRRFVPVPDVSIADVDNDGRTDVVFLSSLTIRVFHIGSSAPDLVPPRFDSGAELKAESRVSGGCCASVSLRWSAAQADGSPPITYQIHRNGTLIGTTRRYEFIDGSAGSAAGYRYTVRAIDAAGNASTQELTADVALRSAVTCRRRASAK